MFDEPATYTPPGGAARAVNGVFTDQVDVAEVGTVGYEASDTFYELRKEQAAGAVTVDDFPQQGELVLDSGAVYTVVYVTQTDTAITLGLAAVEA